MLQMWVLQNYNQHVAVYITSLDSKDVVVLAKIILALNATNLSRQRDFCVIGWKELFRLANSWYYTTSELPATLCRLTFRWGQLEIVKPQVRRFRLICMGLGWV